MLPAGRADRAFFLASVALLGLVVTPLLHAEEHWREAQEEEEEEHTGSRHQHGHSHGGAPGPHGSGTLAHLCMALHAAPQLPGVVVPPAEHAAPLAIAAQLPGTLPWLVPEWSQGPPSGC